MKIRLELMQGNGEVICREINTVRPFQVFGYTFAAHPVVNPDGTFKDPKKCGWVVTEVSSGAIAARGDLRCKAIVNAKRILAEAGEEKTSRSIKYALDQQRRKG